MITLILWLIILNNMNTLQFVYTGYILTNIELQLRQPITSYINFNVRKINDLWNLFYDNNTKSIIIDTNVSDEDYTSLYPFILEKISENIKLLNGIIYYSEIYRGDDSAVELGEIKQLETAAQEKTKNPVLILLGNNIVSIEINFVNELTL